MYGRERRRNRFIVAKAFKHSQSLNQKKWSENFSNQNGEILRFCFRRISNQAENSFPLAVHRLLRDSKSQNQKVEKRERKTHASIHSVQKRNSVNCHRERNYFCR